jgi:predicted PurR-regulated permease PerM
MVSLAVFYAIALTAVGLNFGLLVGLISGLISFVPFLGAIVGFVLSITLALFQFWPDWMRLALVAAVYLGGQALEGNFLTPRFVGREVGLHPVWVIFALLAFGSLFGFVGMLLAVPLAAAVGVLVRFFLARYVASPLYTGIHEYEIGPALEEGSKENSRAAEWEEQKRA